MWSSIWTPGNDELVTWDTSSIPATGDIQGTLLLGLQTADSENLDLDNPLAVNFPLRDGSVHIICPNVSPGNNYIVVLLGDSGNASPQFTISSIDENLDSSPQFAERSFIPSTVALSAPSPFTTATSRSLVVSSSTHEFSSSPLTTSPLTPSSSYPVPSSASSPVVSSSGSLPSSSVGSSSTSPTAGTNRNGALSRTLNAAAIGSTCACATMIMMFFL